MKANLLSISLIAGILFIILVSFKQTEKLGFLNFISNIDTYFLTKEVDAAVEEYYLQSDFSSELIGARFDKDVLLSGMNGFVNAYEANHPNDFGDWEIYTKLIRYDISNNDVVNFLEAKLCVETNSEMKCKIHICEDVEGTMTCHYQLVNRQQMVDHYDGKYSIAIQMIKGGTKLVDSETDATTGVVYYPVANLAELCPTNCPE